MYTKQVVGSLAVSLGIGYLSFASGSTGIAVIAAVALSYFIIRWIWATYHRTRYWLSRGTEGIYSENCPDCERSRYRVSGDWILKCHKCGWKPGVPVLRWIARSVPAIQFQRSVSGTGAFVAGASIATLLFSRPQTTGDPSLRPTTISVATPNLPGFEQLALFGILVLLLIGAILWAMRPRQYYCRNCGQDLGRGDPPDKCPKCGSNRFTNDDPGVGEKVRVEQVE